MGDSPPRELISLADDEGVPLVPPDDWIADHRGRLRQVMDHWVPMLSG